MKKSSDVLCPVCGCKMIKKKLFFPENKTDIPYWYCVKCGKGLPIRVVKTSAS